MRTFKVRSILFLLCLIVFSVALLGCSAAKISKSNITSFKIQGITGVEKEISVADRNKLIDTFNSLHVRKTSYKNLSGERIFVAITYPNRKRVDVEFCGTYLFYSVNGKKAIMCKIDKSMNDLLRETFDNTDLISKKNITSFKISDFWNIEKDIRDKADQDKILDAFNGLSFSDTQDRPMDPDMVTITYSDGRKATICCSGSIISYSIPGSGPVVYRANKDIGDIVRQIYDKTKFDGIDNKVKTITDIVKVNPKDITKIVFTRDEEKVITDKKEIAQTMAMVTSWKFQEIPQQYAHHSVIGTGKFYVGNKEVINIDFSYPININEVPYIYFDLNDDYGLTRFINQMK